MIEFEKFIRNPSPPQTEPSIAVPGHQATCEGCGKKWFKIFIIRAPYHLRAECVNCGKDYHLTLDPEINDPMKSFHT